MRESNPPPPPHPHGGVLNQLSHSPIQDYKSLAEVIDKACRACQVWCQVISAKAANKAIWAMYELRGPLNVSRATCLSHFG